MTRAWTGRAAHRAGRDVRYLDARGLLTARRTASWRARGTRRPASPAAALTRRRTGHGRGPADCSPAAQRPPAAIHAAQAGRRHADGQPVGGHQLPAPLGQHAQRLEGHQGEHLRPAVVPGSRHVRVQAEAGEVVRVDRGNTGLLVTLPSGVTFHNGEKLTAEDVKFTIEGLLDPALGSWLRGFLAPRQGRQVVDETTSKLKTGNFHTLLIPAFTYVDITPQEHGHGPRQARIRSARGRSSSWTGCRTTGSRWTRTTSTGTSRACRRWTGIIFKPVTEMQTRLSQLLAGNVDMVYDFSLQEVPRMQADKRVVVTLNPAGRADVCDVPEHAQAALRQRRDATGDWLGARPPGVLQRLPGRPRQRVGNSPFTASTGPTSRAIERPTATTSTRSGSC